MKRLGLPPDVVAYSAPQEHARSTPRAPLKLALPNRKGLMSTTRKRAPSIGQHSDDVLCGAGHSADRSAGCVKQV
jgi:hypothetical protein